MGKRIKGVTLQRQENWYKRHIQSIDNGKYEPFWRVEDVNSSGIKVKTRHFNDHHRVVHLLSMNEMFMYQLIAWDSSIVECYEQYAFPLIETLAIAEKLEVKHPVYVGTSVPIVQTMDFLCIRDDGSQVAFPVKQESWLENVRTIEKLAIQEAYCAIKEIDYQLMSSDFLKTEHNQNLERLSRHALLPSLLHKPFLSWLPNFIGTLALDRHQRVATILEKSAEKTGIPYQRAANFLYHAIYNNLLEFNWLCPLILDAAASDLELYPNDA